MPHLPTVAIVGAGSSGITAAKALHERGIAFDCFEASDRIGGNWVFANKNGMSAAYRDLHINTSRDLMAFSDFPMPRSCPDFPHHTDIAAYFEAYVDHFGFRDQIRFETAIRRAQMRADGTWQLSDEAGVRRAYDMLLVANGHHWDARWPDPPFPGAETFQGRQLHAHEYRDNRFLEDRDVVVLGMGNSAMDIAVESSHVARATHLAARRGAWIVPKYRSGGRRTSSSRGVTSLSPSARRPWSCCCACTRARPSALACSAPTTRSAPRIRRSPSASSIASPTA
jgi:cation diffusion facilitator CzcD-associated flavoprotein CzcO